MHTSFHFFVSILCILREIADIKCQEWSNSPDIDRHLQLARELLSQGMYNDALSHYHAAVDADPLNYLTFYTRASVYLAIGKIASALKDLTKVIELKPDFTAARLQRGKVFLKQGRLDEAHIDYENVLRVDPMNPEAHEGYNVIEPIKKDVNLAFALVQDRNFQDAIHLLDRLLQEVPWDSSIRELRAECYESAGDLKSAIQDLKSVIKSQSESLARHLKLSQLYYQIGDAEESLNSVRECLRFDPDHKDCFSHYKYVKKVSAHLKAMESASRSGDSTECVGRANKVLALEQRVHAVVSHVKATRCKCFRKGGHYKEAVSACTDALDMMPDNSDLLCERAEAHLENGNYDDAISDFQRASQSGDRAQRNRANEGKQRAAKIRKQLNKRNYYDILGVKKNAGKREIIKAYRQLALKWHPDNFQDSPQKEAAEKKFIEIAAAKEVLTDAEKRAKFDQGEDPLDPENQQGNPFDPFQQGRPFSFKFHFS